jgi:hypothetical protein
MVSILNRIFAFLFNMFFELRYFQNKNISKDNKTNIEEQVWNNLHEPGLTLDKSGITYTYLNFSVIKKFKV